MSPVGIAQIRQIWASLRYAHDMRAIAAGVVIGALVGGAILPMTGRAQPAPDMLRAKDFYKSAEAGMKEGRFLDAARDYGAAYEITRDPILFYKIGSANERAGKCDVALIYYGRYLREGKPSEAFVSMTRERITACGGNPDADNAGSAVTAGSAGSSEPVIVPTVGPGSGSAAGSDAGSATTVTGVGSAAGSGSAVHLSSSNQGAWILVASSIALVTVGGVLAYAASSSENDVNDLYEGFTGQPPAFDARTQQTYNDLVDEGNRYEKLSWISFGLAGATAIGAAVLFYRHSNESSVQVAPTASATSGGVSATVRW
jgi:hypothetical protein